VCVDGDRGGRPAELVVERSVHRLDQIALHGRGLVLGSSERDDDLDRVFAGTAIEQHARSRVGEHPRMGFDDRANPFDYRVEPRPLRHPEAHFAGMRRRVVLKLRKGWPQTPPFGTMPD
jgi:hypothetical protein